MIKLFKPMICTIYASSIIFGQSINLSKSYLIEFVISQFPPEFFYENPQANKERKKKRFLYTKTELKKDEYGFQKSIFRKAKEGIIEDIFNRNKLNWIDDNLNYNDVFLLNESMIVTNHGIYFNSPNWELISYEWLREKAPYTPVLSNKWLREKAPLSEQIYAKKGLSEDQLSINKIYKIFKSFELINRYQKIETLQRAVYFVLNPPANSNITESLYVLGDIKGLLEDSCNDSAKDNILKIKGLGTICLKKDKIYNIGSFDNIISFYSNDNELYVYKSFPLAKNSEFSGYEITDIKKTYHKESYRFIRAIESLYSHYNNGFTKIGLSNINRENIINDFKYLKKDFIETSGIKRHFTERKIDGIKNIQTVITGWKFPNNRAQDAYLTALLRMNNPTEMEANYLERQFQVPIRQTVDRSTSDKTVRNNKIVEVNSTFTLKKPTWKEISSFYGSPLALMKDGINQTNFLQEFELNSTLESVEFINSKECLIKVKLMTRNKKGKDFHKLPKTTYNYKGTYKVNLSFDDILKGEKPPIKVKFVNKKYLPKEEFEIPVDNFIDVNYEDYRKELLDLSASKIKAYKNLVQYSEEDLNISCKCLNDMDYYSNNAKTCEQSLTNTLSFDWQSVDLTTDKRAAAILENLTKNCKN